MTTNDSNDMGAGLWYKFLKFWKRWVYNTALAPEWKIHPREVYGILSRTIMAVLGSLVPIGTSLLGSGVLQRLDEGTQRIGLVFYVVLSVICAAWLLGIVKAVRSELKELYDYAIVGSVYPANVLLIGLALQAVR